MAVLRGRMLKYSDALKLFSCGNDLQLRCSGYSEHGDVVLLAPALRGLGDFGCVLRRERGQAVKTKQLALRIAGFYHAVGGR